MSSRYRLRIIYILVGLASLHVYATFLNLWFHHVLCSMIVKLGVFFNFLEKSFLLKWDRLWRLDCWRNLVQ